MDHFKHHFYVFSLLLLLFSIGCYSQSCSDEFIEVGNKIYDINPIKSIPFSVKNGGYDYKFTICDVLQQGYCGQCSTFSGCREKTGSWDDWCLGISSESNKYEEVSGGKGLAITYDNGDPYYQDCWAGKRRKLRIEILCDKEVDGLPINFEVKEPKCNPLTYEYIISFKHKSGCAIGPCEPNPCQNGGKCTSINNDEYTCECLEPYYGTNCTNTVVNPIYVRNLIESYVPESQVKYYTVLYPNPHYTIDKNDSLYLQFKSYSNSCNYIVVDGKSIFFGKYIYDPLVNSTAKVHMLNSNATVKVSYSNLLSGSISISVFAIDDDCHARILAATRDDVCECLIYK